MRSAQLGGNLYTVPNPTSGGDTANEPAANAAATERENLVRTLAFILNPNTVAAPAEGIGKVGSPAPSSNVNKTVGEGARHFIAATVQKLKLAEALVSFLPPPREERSEGVTTESVALKPEWCAPPAVTVNVCGCLLHLLGAESSGHIAEQVCTRMHGEILKGTIVPGAFVLA